MSLDMTEDDSTSWPIRLRWAVMLIIFAETEKLKIDINIISCDVPQLQTGSKKQQVMHLHFD